MVETQKDALVNRPGRGTLPWYWARVTNLGPPPAEPGGGDFRSGGLQATLFWPVVVGGGTVPDVPVDGV